MVTQIKLSKKVIQKNLPTHSKARIWTLLTGHGQNVGSGPQNCAEFCDKIHKFEINKQVTERRIWRNDCSKTITSEMRGNWTVPRAGWCPGDIVRPLLIDIEGNQQTISVSWSPEKWTNPHNEGFDGNRHTPPFYQISGFLVLYE